MNEGQERRTTDGGEKEESGVSHSTTFHQHQQ
jgi:hypothetical protein